MKVHRTAKWTFAVLLLVLTPSWVRAQAVASAEIHGTVLDAAGAVIPGAKVTVIQTATGQIRTTVSNSDGSYVLPNLPVGPYKLEVSGHGFKDYVQSGILLQVGNNVGINVTLQVGAVTQQVQVSANAAMVETQDTSVSEVVDQRRA